MKADDNECAWVPVELKSVFGYPELGSRQVCMNVNEFAIMNELKM